MGTQCPTPEAGASQARACLGPQAVGRHSHDAGRALTWNGDKGSGQVPGAPGWFPTGGGPLTLPPVYWTRSLGVPRTALVFGRGALSS